ncbi:MAG: ComF family protein [Treponema sp.]|jgi:ComF family protein|nr:ComF family protein [Treponema sp.]
MDKFIHLLFWVRGFFFPESCALCGKNLINVSEICYCLCQECLSLIEEQFNASQEEKKCNLCNKTLISEIETCLLCRNGTLYSYDRLWTLFPYTGKFRTLLTAYKFGKKLALANYFTEKVINLIQETAELKEVCLIPVPPRPGKIKNTGWDQVDYLVRRISKLSKGSIRVYRCLERRKSKIQKQLNRKDRLENMKGRIFLNDIVPLTAIVIDDVITTGSTIEVCSSVLKDAGAQKVYGLCLFYD